MDQIWILTFPVWICICYFLRSLNCCTKVILIVIILLLFSRSRSSESPKTHPKKKKKHWKYWSSSSSSSTFDLLFRYNEIIFVYKQTHWHKYSITTNYYHLKNIHFKDVINCLLKSGTWFVHWWSCHECVTDNKTNMA